MIAPTRLHTWTRWATAKVPWVGSAGRFASLWTLLVGVLPDAQAEASRQVARMLVPVDGTHPETIPHLLRAFGLPGYAVEQPLTEPAGYFAAMARLRDAWATHAVAGSTTMLDAELVRAGVVGVSVVNLTGAAEGADFAISVPTASDGVEYNNGGVGPFYDDGNTYDLTITPTEAQGIAAVLAYFKPARSLFRGLVP